MMPQTHEKIQLPFIIGAIIAWALRGYKKPTPPQQSKINFQEI